MTLRRTLLPLLLVLSSASPVAAQAVPRGPIAPTAPLDADARRDVVAQLSQALRDRYIFPDVGEKAAARISAALAAGDYDRLTDPSAFAARLAADVGAIAHDKHLNVSANGAMPGPPPGPPMLHAEAGITRADKLDGGIGYIEVTNFPPPGMFKPVLDRAMIALKGSRALIIDVRRNGGGMPAAVSYLSSFLLPPEKAVVLNVIVMRDPKTSKLSRDSIFSQPTPVNFADVPIYVLTSKATFSGGEGFAYEVQALKRATVVGEVTGGGANPSAPVPIGHGLMATIPFGRAENPVTRTNWEGRGVQPDMTVPAADALKVALEKLGQKPVADIETASRTRVFAPRTTPMEGTEAALRQAIAGFISGKPDLTNWIPPAAAGVRDHLPEMQASLSALGPLQSMRFREVGAMGEDRYEVTFAKGIFIIGIGLAPDGKIVGMSPPMPAPPGH